ncbi:hypothetical protein CFP56_026625 [Quercus suber]|uniref:RNase H type-1 domain-containing protein n=1 Tax=Quercus suber TaxID=58331 RepID=A0AAW0K0N9_QUESU
MLIDKERCCWIEDVVDNNFIPHEARMIKSITLCFSNAEDKLYWPSMVDRAYSIKAGYRFLIDDELIPNLYPNQMGASPYGLVQINFDGMVFQEKGEAGLGIIIYNDHGLVMAALTQVIPLPTSVEIMEVLAARRALIFAKELTFDHIILEGDSDIAIYAMKGEGYSTASFGHILSDIKALVAHFKHVVFRHTRRQGNKVAHNLARAACNFYPFCTWIEEIPVVFVVDYIAEIINE